MFKESETLTVFSLDPPEIFTSELKNMIVLSDLGFSWAPRYSFLIPSLVSFKFQAGTDKVQSTNPEKMHCCNFNMACLTFRPTKQYIWMAKHVALENLNKVLVLLLQLGLGVIQGWWPTGGANASLDGRWRRVHHLSLNMYIHYPNPLQMTKQISPASPLNDPAWVPKDTCRKQLYMCIPKFHTAALGSWDLQGAVSCLAHQTVLSPYNTLLCGFCVCKMFIAWEGH